MIVFQADKWRKICNALFRAAGASDSNALRVTESLVDSSLTGHDSHGIVRTIQYIDAIEKGHLNPAAEPRIVKESHSTSMIDGNWAFGQVGAHLAIQKALEQAKKHGVAIAGLTRAYHIGRLGEYSEVANKAGMIAIVTVGGFQGVGGAKNKTGVVPYGGSRPIFGTNPFAFGIPNGDKPGVVVDFATSAVAGGKISVARAKGLPLPDGSILDKAGNPTNNAEDFYDGGMLLTFGGHKGYGLAVVSELLGRVLTGADRCQEESLGGELYTKTGSVFIVIDPTIFRPFEDFVSAADDFINKIKETPPAPGFKEVLVPGEPEYRTRGARITDGISLPESSWQTLQGIANKYGVELNPAS